MEEVIGWMQAPCAALQDIAFACTIGAATLWGQNFRLRLLLVMRWSVGILFIALMIYLVVSAAVMTDTRGEDLPLAVWLVLTQSHFGNTIWIGGAACLMLALILFAPGMANAGKIRKALFIIAMVAFAFSRAATGHAINQGMVSFAVLNHTLHVIAGCTWLGIAALGAGAACYWRDWGRVERVALTQRISAVATVALILMIGTGIINTICTVGFEHLTLNSAYTSILAVKFAGVVAAASLGAYNRWISIPRLLSDDNNAARQFQMVLLIETLVLAFVLFAATRLATTMPP